MITPRDFFGWTRARPRLGGDETNTPWACWWDAVPMAVLVVAAVVVIEKVALFVVASMVVLLVAALAATCWRN